MDFHSIRRKIFNKYGHGLDIGQAHHVQLLILLLLKLAFHDNNNQIDLLEINVNTYLVVELLHFSFF